MPQGPLRVLRWRLTVHPPSHTALSCASLLPASALCAKAYWTPRPHRATGPSSPAAMRHIQPSAWTCCFALHLKSLPLLTHASLCNYPLRWQSMALASPLPCAAALPGAPPTCPGTTAECAEGCSTCMPLACCMCMSSRAHSEMLRCWAWHYLSGHVAQVYLGH